LADFDFTLAMHIKVGPMSCVSVEILANFAASIRAGYEKNENKTNLDALFHP
jgi:hypothetical protein